MATQPAPPVQPIKQWTSQQVMLATVWIAAVVAGFWLLFRLRALLLILFIAIIISTAIRPAVKWLARRGLPRVYAEILIYLLFLVAVVSFVVLLLPMLLDQGTALSSLLIQYYRQFRQMMVNSPSNILHRLGFELPWQFLPESLIPANDGAPSVAPGQATETPDLVASVFGAAAVVVRALFLLVAVTLVTFYWTLEGERAIRTILFPFPPQQREKLRELYDAVEARLGGFLLGQGILCAIIGVLSLIAYLIIGLPNALVLALLAGILEALPTIGPVLGAIPAVLVAASTDPSKIIWVVVASMIIQFLENNLLVPRVMDRSVGVTPLLTLLLLATLTSLLGLPGALLAVPVAAIIQLLLNRFVFEQVTTPPAEPEGRDRLSYLRMQAQEIALDIRRHGMEEADNEKDRFYQVKNEMEAIAGELDQVLAQTAQAQSAQSIGANANSKEATSL